MEELITGGTLGICVGVWVTLVYLVRSNRA
jgi:hypothetical protein